MEIMKSGKHLVGFKVGNNMEHNSRAKEAGHIEKTWVFKHPGDIEDMQETEIGVLTDKNQGVANANVETASEKALTEVCYVSENVSTSHSDVKRSHNKDYMKLYCVSSNHIPNMELDENLDEHSDKDEINEESTENDKTSCVCKCHCRRNFQKQGLSKKSKLKSSGYDRKYNSDKLLNISRRNKPIGVIKPNESNQTSFRTRLKSENSTERSSGDISEGQKLCINLAFVRIRRVMAKILCHCVLLLLLCLCGGVVMVHFNVDKTNSSVIHSIPVGGLKGKEDDLATQEPSVILNIPFRSVSKDVFYKHLSKSNSAAEMLKIFFNDSSLTEEQVNSIMFMKKHQSYGSKRMSGDMMMNDDEDEQNYRELAYQHYVDFERNPLSDCKEPKPEVIRIEDTNSDSVHHFLPSCTIVHRCRNHTACCPRGHICAPKKENGIQLVDKFFMVLESVPGSEDLRPAKDLIAARTFINHTACECQKVEVDTNCHKSCPLQFTKTRPGIDCECRCSTGHRKCHRIHKGLLPLDEKDLECIKEDRCIIPNCHAGEFSISSGFCPHFRRFRKSL